MRKGSELYGHPQRSASQSIRMESGQSTRPHYWRLLARRGNRHRRRSSATVRGRARLEWHDSLSGAGCNTVTIRALRRVADLGRRRYRPGAAGLHCHHSAGGGERHRPRCRWAWLKTALAAIYQCTAMISTANTATISAAITVRGSRSRLIIDPSCSVCSGNAQIGRMATSPRGIILCGPHRPAGVGRRKSER